MQPKWRLRMCNVNSTMELTTRDGVHYKLSQEFVNKSQLLSDMAEGHVSVPIDNETLAWLVKSEWPTDGHALLKMAKAADFLHMEKDLSEACKRVAESLRGKTTKEIEDFFNL